MGYTMYTIFTVYIVSSIILTIISIVFKIGGKLRLGLPLAYLLLIITIFSDWADKNEKLAIYILIGLIVASIASWLLSLREYIVYRRYHKAIENAMSLQLQKARDYGIDTNELSFNTEGSLIYTKTGVKVFK